VGRSMEGDAASVSLCRQLVEALNGQLIKFDFRNGPLRRKYDSVKYAVKRLEELLYEQSLLTVVATAAKDDQGGGGSDKKRVRVEEEDNSPAAAAAAVSAVCALVDEGEFSAMVSRMEQSDAAREGVIKGCRDGQKLSKLAIYSVHRGEMQKASEQLEQAHTKTAALLPQVSEWPTLRQGTFTNVLEEFAEAKMFHHWMTCRRIPPLAAGVAGEAFPLLDPSEDAAAYIGGLVDLTGELGRYAVACGTARRVDDVEQCFEATCVVSTLLAQLPSSQALRKKGSAVATNLRKMGQVRYELALAARGRTKVLVDTTASEASSSGAGGPEKTGAVEE